MAKKARPSGSSTSTKDVKVETPSKKSFDSELDALFSAAAQPARPSKDSLAPIPAAQKTDVQVEIEQDEDDGEDEDIMEVEDEEENEEEDEEEDDEEEDEEEDVNTEAEADDSDSDVDERDENLVHETLLQSSKDVKTKRKTERTTEPQEVRDRRSIFVGNLPISIIQDRPAIKALKAHLVAQSPFPSATHIEVIRFRSIPFSAPTDDYEARNPEEADSKVRKRNRTQAYKDALANEGGSSAASSSSRNTYLTGSQKRKIAFITQKVNEKADSVNAYVTLSPLTNERTSTLRQNNDDEKVDRLTANVLAALLARSAHNSVYEGRHIRVDLVTGLQPYEVVESGLDKVKTADGSMLGVIAGGGGVDQEGRRRTAFVGNLDFEMREEEVRTFFNQLLTSERGEAPSVSALDFSHCALLPMPEASSDAAIVEERSWVQDVRIIRDAATQMGKGFAYVRFLDATCVDEIIAIHESEEAFLAAAKSGKGATPPSSSGFRRKLKLKGRPLRVARCKVPKGHVTPKRRGNGVESNEPSGVRTPRPNSKQHAAGQRSRSTGAPTPGGSSPYAAKRQRLNAPDGSPTRQVKSDKHSTPNPLPKNTDPLRVAEIARKKADPARQARRMAKKTAKRTEMKMKAVAKETGGTSGKVSLKPKTGGAKGTKRNVGRTSDGGGGGGASSNGKTVRSSNKTTSSSFGRRAIGTLTLLASLLSVLVNPVEANNEIVNFGPKMCAADEIGHLQDNAARQVSQSWPIVRSLSGPRVFTLDPISQPDVWLTLLLVSDEDDERRISAQGSETIDQIKDLASAAFPLLTHDGDQRAVSPRDRWLNDAPRMLAWHMWEKRFSFRVNWPANFPINVKATVHDARSMLASGKVRWQANEHLFEAQKRTSDEEQEAPQWPCARVYVHIHVEDDTVFIPPRRTAEERAPVKTIWDRVYYLLVDVAEWYIGPLTNEGPDAMEEFLRERESPSPMPVPVHLVLEPLYLGFVPHTSLTLLAILLPALLLAYFFAVPWVKAEINDILEERETALASEANEEEERKRQ